jgi:Cu+-exporting ATPase
MKNQERGRNQVKKLDEIKLNDQLSSEGLSCDCCDESLALPRSSSLTPKMEQKQEEHRDHEEYSVPETKKLVNDKTLIVIGLVLTATIVILELMLPNSFTTGFIMFVLATPVQFLLGKQFYIRFLRAIKNRKRFTTDTLVVLSTSIAYLYSLFTLFSFTDSHQFFEASSSVLTIFTIGEYLERRVLKTTNESLKNLLTLKPKAAIVIRDGREVSVNSDDIIIGDIVIAKPGEKIAVDGVVVDGKTSIDESMITGESIPVDRETGDNVIGGTINKNGYIQFKATKIGSTTVLANIIEIVKKARSSKASVQRIADRAVQYFIPIVLIIAASSALYWFLVAHEPIPFAVTVFATVLVVSCPCALGIATPMVISLAIDKATRHGVLIKGGKYVEELSSVDTVVFDKTGTLTNGKPEVTDIIPSKDYSASEVLQLASSVEIKSEHPIAQSIVKKATEQTITPLEISEFRSVSGSGVLASFQKKRVFVGNVIGRGNDSNQQGSVPEGIKNKITYLELEGKTVVGVFIEDNLTGLIAIADTLRDNARYVIDEIRKMHKDVILMSGDNNRTATAIARQLGIDVVLAEVSPENKATEIVKLQNRGKKVMMIGDGINDAPALTQADIGITMGSGTDVAISSGHIILMKSDLNHILYTLKLGQYAFRKIKQNLAMSFTYNVVTISIAAGLLYGITNSLILTPALAALGWVISDTAVFGNSLLVRKFKMA